MVYIRKSSTDIIIKLLKSRNDNSITATIDNLEAVYSIVQNSIKETYPKYYPGEVVDFFCDLHSKEVPLINSENGEVDGNTVFLYHQNGYDFSAE